MNTDSLQPLEGRWPNDKIVVEKRVSLTDVTELFSTPAGQNVYQDNLAVDVEDGKFISNFAAANSMSYLATPSFNTSQYGSTIPAWLGAQTNTTQPIFVHEVTGTLYGYSIRFCVAYTPTGVQDRMADVDRANESVRMTKKSIIRVTLPKVFPQMVLDSNKNDKGYASTIPTSFRNSQKLTLEGGFADYFDFYAPVGLQINALTVLAPNFMQIVIDSATTFDVEFFGNEMILVTKDSIYTPSVMQAALHALEAQLGYLDRLLASWNYQPINAPFDLLDKTSVDGSVIKVGGFRMKPAVVLILILAGFVLYGTWIVFSK